MSLSYFPVILLVSGLILAASIVWTSLRVGISPMPSSSAAINAMVELLGPGPHTALVDLGSGWGQLCGACALRWRAPTTGYELSYLPYLWSSARSSIAKDPLVRFHRDDFSHVDLSQYSGIVCYLYPEAMSRLAVRCRSLPSGTVIVSNTFRLPGWEPERVVHLDDLYRTPIYRYVV